MIIKQIKIQAFGGLENININFKRGINLIYGENEKGKSTIEMFIKTMLFGFSRKKVNFINDRARYKPLSGKVISGELIVEYEGRNLIIKRIFKDAKKEDITEILDLQTGEELKIFSFDEPGKSFLGVNEQTFERTLFIRQLGVLVTKDKEEEIIERLTSVFGCSDNETSAKNALDKLNSKIKELKTARNVGTIDILKKKEALLVEQQYEGYKVSEKNIAFENELLVQKNNREILNNELSKLEVYKKYIKRVKLQSEYKDITEYLKKSEQLKNEENQIIKNLENENGIIDDTFIESLKEENKKYMAMLDKSEEIKNELNQKKSKYDDFIVQLGKFKYFEGLGDNIKDKLLSLKYESAVLEDKIKSLDSIKESIIKYESEIVQKEKSIGKSSEIKNYKTDIEKLFNEYEYKLKEYSLAVNDKNEGKTSTIYIIGIVASIIVGSLIFIINSKLALISIAFLLLGAFFAFKLVVEKKGKYNIKTLNKRINQIETDLNSISSKTGIKDLNELLYNYKKYSEFEKERDNLQVRIEEKKELFNEAEYNDIKNKYNKDIEIIGTFLRLSGFDNIDDILKDIDIYQKLKLEADGVKRECDLLSDNLFEIKKELKLSEELLKNKLKVMDIEDEELLDVDVYIKEYKERIEKRKEIHQNLESVEKTYSALLKNRDIEKIKMELKDIINSDNTYIYQTEEEVETEEKRKSNQLIECEKSIKDLEHKINTRLIGKRQITEIEEELQSTREKIAYEEKVYNALNIAYNTLEDSKNQITRDIGPELNKNISEVFSYLTDNKYTSVLLQDNYKMTVKSEGSFIKGDYLSNGAIDQLYLALRIALVDLIFKNQECPVILDDAFIQYDSKRKEKALSMLASRDNYQSIIFTCSEEEQRIIESANINANIINL